MTFLVGGRGFFVNICVHTELLPPPLPLFRRRRLSLHFARLRSVSHFRYQCVLSSLIVLQSLESSWMLPTLSPPICFPPRFPDVRARRFKTLWGVLGKCPLSFPFPATIWKVPKLKCRPPQHANCPRDFHERFRPRRLRPPVKSSRVLAGKNVRSWTEKLGMFWPWTYVESFTNGHGVGCIEAKARELHCN